MFTKRKVVGAVTKNVIDWEAIGGAIIIGFIVLAILGSLGG